MGVKKKIEASGHKAHVGVAHASTDRNYLIALVFLLLFALLYSIAFVGGPSFYGDDTVYANLAYYAVHGSFTQSPFIFSVRLLNIYPTALFYYLFGINLYTDSAWDIVSFLGMIVVAYFLGKELHSNLAGILSATLIAFFPLIVQISATISDDIPLAFVSSLAMLALLYGQRKSSKAWYFIAGVLLIATPLVTPEGFIVIITAAAYLLVELARKKISLNGELPFLGYGAAAALILLFCFNFITSGNPLITFTTNSNFYSAVGQQNTIPSTNTDPMFYIRTMFSYNILGTLFSNLGAGNFNPLSIWSQIYQASTSTAGLYFYALVIAAIYLVLARERRAYFALFWFMASFLYLEFGPMHISLSPFSYLLTYRLDRFLTIIAVPLVAVLGVAFARMMVDTRKAWKAVGTTLAGAAFFILILTALPINLYWHQSLYAATYDQIAMGQFLSALPSSTPVYFTGAFSNVLVYMQFSNMSRFVAYDQIKNCSKIPAGSYVLIPKYSTVFGLPYTPNPLVQCPSWRLVLSPKIPLNLSQSIIGPAAPFRGDVYFVPPTGASINYTASLPKSNSSVASASYLGINYFNLTGVGYLNASTRRLTNFVVVNNVSTVRVALNLTNASVGQKVLASVFFNGTFKWYKSNASSYYLSSNIINVHYFGVELSNQTGKLLDQNNGPWQALVNQSGEPHQLIYGNTNSTLLINWVISPSPGTRGSTLKICGGYFATYKNTTLGGGWGSLYNTLSMAQTRSVNASVVSIPSQNCVLLNVR
ncbi:MAG: glycosyltransferase family 39 protein [Candidatus Micrarchaeota archaeon]|nr:glycosyltransferase family 39 protein [Candidatus Micrarchaeota archaeon]